MTDDGVFKRFETGSVENHMTEKKQKILIVDDSSTVRRIIREEFKDSGYELSEANDGFETCRKL